MSITGALQGAFLKLHQALYERTDGRIGKNLGGTPCLLLFTVGARTGAARTSALVYAPDGDGYVVVGSNGGQERSPGWIFNLKANPNSEIQVGRERLNVSSLIVNKGDADYERLWGLVNKINKDRYDAYQLKTPRPIPLAVLIPR